LGATALLVLFVVAQLSRHVPASLVVLVLSAIAVRLLGLDARVIATVGDVPAGRSYRRLIRLDPR